jgi:hypothetical protein
MMWETGESLPRHAAAAGEHVSTRGQARGVASDAAYPVCRASTPNTSPSDEGGEAVGSVQERVATAMASANETYARNAAMRAA